MSNNAPFASAPGDFLTLVRTPAVATTLAVAFATLVTVGWLGVGSASPYTASEKRRLAKDFAKEFWGSIVMIWLCFPPGPFLGHLPGYEEVPAFPLIAQTCVLNRSAQLMLVSV